MILNELVIYQQAIYFYGNAFLLTWTKHWNSVLYSDGRRFPCRAFDPGRVLQCYSAAAALQQNLSFTRKTKLLLPAILCGTWCDIFIFKRMTIKPLQYFRSHPASKSAQSVSRLQRFSMRQNGETVQTPGRSLRWGWCQCPDLSLVPGQHTGLWLTDTDTTSSSRNIHSAPAGPRPHRPAKHKESQINKPQASGPLSSIKSQGLEDVWCSSDDE